ncbi:putative glyoxalase superfamily protein PhnB [Murinocardiopsis flavida]|uniref:Putative glyoxalase superfamily protein PhnB n=1 Tax=Murinocardiopsis flavida TaxID=645275 RepID=A0A2P8CSZ8_9ACTN|nr:VOC family protein [Murinocardiopsis flavida]PSK88079.1 putative glyoxalase superfamily protein PhnB [Murinocardiopsis flavida]
MTRQHDAPQVWRTRNDSSGRTEPRVLIRVFLAPDGLDTGIAFYERLQDTEADARFSFPAARLRLAVVGAFLLIAGTDEALAPFRSTTGTLLVADVRPYYDRLVAEGAEIVFPLQEVPTGAGFNARHPDGTVVEYVHHRPAPDGS